MRRMRLEGILTPAPRDRLHLTVMAYLIWQAMCGSGVGIGLGRLMPVALILVALRQSRTVRIGAAVGTAARSTVGRRIGAASTRRSATRPPASGPSFPQVSKTKVAL